MSEEQDAFNKVFTSLMEGLDLHDDRVPSPPLTDAEEILLLEELVNCGNLTPEEAGNIYLGTAYRKV